MARLCPPTVRVPAFSSSPVLLGAFAWLLLALSPPPAWAESEAFLVAPRKLFPGSEASATLRTFSGADRSPLAAGFELRLAPDQGEGTLLRTSRTGADGWANLTFEVPREVRGGAYRLVARVEGLAAPLAIPVSVVETPVLLIETDKPIYKPGQTVQGRVLLLNNGLRPIAGGIVLSIHDARGNKIARRDLTANRFGVATFELPLARELNAGEWKIEAASGEGKAQAAVRVEPYVLPRFRLEAELDRGWFLAHEPITGTVRSSYFFGKPVEGEATVAGRRLVDGEWQEYARRRVEMRDGAARFELDPAGQLARPESGSAAVSLEIAVSDGAGHAEKTTQLAPIVEAPFAVWIASRSASVKPGIPLELSVGAADPAGRPLSLAVEVSVVAYDDSEQVVGRWTREVVAQGGRAQVSFPPVPPRSLFLVLEAESSEGPYRSTARSYGPVAYSPSGSYLHIARASDRALLVGETAEFEIVSSQGGATFFEVQAGGRAVLSGSAGDRIRFAAVPAMAPEAKLIVYRVFSSGEVGADSRAFAVRPAPGVTLEAAFDAARVEPGQPVKVQVSAGAPSMVGVAIVDESVLALGQSRLDLAALYLDLQSRFGGPSDRELQSEFTERPLTVGSRDVLARAGLDVAVSPGLDSEVAPAFPLGSRFFPGGKIQRGSYGLPPLEGAEGNLAEVTRVRQFFPETWLWQPLLETDTAGRATLELVAPDSITNWKLRAVSTSQAGLGLASGDLTVFQEFFVEPDLPYAVTRGEEMWLPVAVYNYLDAAQSVELRLEPSEGFEILGSEAVSVSIGPNAVAGASFPIRTRAIGTFLFKLTARGQARADAVVRPLRVEPEGAPVETVLNSVVKARESLRLDASFPAGRVPGSERLVLSVTGSQVAQSIQGVEDLCGRPYG